MPESERSILARVGSFLQFERRTPPPPRGTREATFIHQTAFSHEEIVRQEYVARHSPEARAEEQYAIMEAAFSGYAITNRKAGIKIDFMGLFHEMVQVGMESPELRQLYSSTKPDRHRRPAHLTRKNIRDSRYIGARMAKLGISPAGALHVIEHFAPTPNALAPLTKIYREAKNMEDVNRGLLQRRHSLPQPVSRR